MKGKLKSRKDFGRQSFLCEFKSVDLEEGTFEGHASTFGNVDRTDDIIERGAFKRTIDQRFKKGLIKILWNHNSDEPIGVPTEMREDDHGLFVKGKISSTSRGLEVLQLMRDKVITHMSIGFRIIKQEIQSGGSGAETPIRVLKELELFEFSPVTFPANEMAAVSAVKDLMDETFEEKEMEELIEQLKVLNETVKSLGTKIESLELLVKTQTPVKADSEEDDPAESDEEKFAEELLDRITKNV